MKGIMESVCGAEQGYIWSSSSSLPLGEGEGGSLVAVVGGYSPAVWPALLSP